MTFWRRSMRCWIGGCFRGFWRRGLKRSGLAPQGYDPLVLFTCLLVGQWHGLSDPRLERALKVRLDFIEFCGLDLHGSVPDETTHCRFRNALTKAGIFDDLLAEVCRQIEAHCLKLRAVEAAIIDATLIETAAQSPNAPCKQNAATKPMTVANPAARPDGGNVFAIKTPLGPGDITKSDATRASVKISDHAMLCSPERGPLVATGHRLIRSQPDPVRGDLDGCEVVVVAFVASGCNCVKVVDIVEETLDPATRLASLRACGGGRGIGASLVPMPETAVNGYHRPIPCGHAVWSTGPRRAGATGSTGRRC